MTDHLGRLLLVTLEAAGIKADMPVLSALHSWLDSWREIGAIERGMAQQGYDLQLTPVRREGLAHDVLHDGDGARAGTRRTPQTLFDDPHLSPG
jgi:hypothetical protein